ncbi:MAG: cytochrome c4 [Gallionellaceae bacterium]|jgi:cytochrome c553|nr:cytochrome c4 [Gallionellaceae bacterium]
MHCNFIASLAIMLICTLAAAGESPEEIRLRVGAGDLVAGKEKSAKCQACHGEDGNSRTDNYPKLAGQYAAYIRQQIHDFKSGARVDPVMSAMAASVESEQDLLDIAAYFASQKPMKGESSVDNKVGKARYLGFVTGCRSCHVPAGEEPAKFNPEIPVIAGQHKEYLIKQLKDYKRGTRRNESNGAMSLMTRYMTDRNIEDVASYVSGL